MSGSPYLELLDWRRQMSELFVDLRRRPANAETLAWFRAQKDALFKHHPQSPIPEPERAQFAGLAYWPFDPAARVEAQFRALAQAPPESGAGDEDSDSATGVSGPARQATGVSSGPAQLATGVSGPAQQATGVSGRVQHGLGVSERAQQGTGVSGRVQQGTGVSGPAQHAAGVPFSRIGHLEFEFLDHKLSLGAFWIEGYAGGLFVPFTDATSGHQTYGGGRYVLDTIKSADLDSDAAANLVTLDFNYAYHPSCTYDPRWVCPLAPPDSRLAIPIPAGERLR